MENNSKDVKQKDITDLIDEEISMDDLHAYKQQGFIARLPDWVKAIFIKYWFYGAICFFALMGTWLIGENAAIFAGVLAGGVFDLVVYNILIMMESDENESRHFIMYKSKKIWSVFINMCYEVVVFFLAMLFCSTIVNTYKDPVNNWFLQEPFSQGLVLLVFDAVFITIKGLLVLLVKKIKGR